MVETEEGTEGSHPDGSLLLLRRRLRRISRAISGLEATTTTTLLPTNTPSSFSNSSNPARPTTPPQLLSVDILLPVSLRQQEDQVISLVKDRRALPTSPPLLLLLLLDSVSSLFFRDSNTSNFTTSSLEVREAGSIRSLSSSNSNSSRDRSEETRAGWLSLGSSRATPTEEEIEGTRLRR